MVIFLVVTLMNLLAEMRLNENEGTHSTSVKMRHYEILTVPMCVKDTKLPLGNLTDAETIAVIVVKEEIHLII